MAKYTLQTRTTDTLNGTMAASAVSCTLLSGNFGSPTGKQIITIDYDVSAKAADFLCTIADTAVTSMTLLNGSDVEHTTGANVAMTFVDEHYSLLMNTQNDGWLDPVETWAYASASTITVPSGAAARYAVGDKIKWTQTTVKYGVITGIADTVLTIAVNTDYVVTDATISANYYSKQASPVGFPVWFAWTPTWTGSGTLTYASVTYNRQHFAIIGGVCLINLNIAGGTVANSDTNIGMTLPVDCIDGNSIGGMTQGIDDGSVKNVAIKNDGTTNSCDFALVSGNWTNGTVTFIANFAYPIV